jgi:hypothetical protein
MRVSDLHVIPPWEDENHEVKPDCYCCPRLDSQDLKSGQRIYVHYGLEEAH